MSRSYKKSPFCKDSCTKWSKRQAARAVRRYDDFIPDGCGYKKLYCSWLICDFKCRHPWNIDSKKDYDTRHHWAKYHYYK